MKPPEDVKRKIMAEWLRKADADMGLAEHLIGEGTVFPDAVAFHSQQAAEKYLKAFLTWHQVAFPKTHDLDFWTSSKPSMTAFPRPCAT